MTDLDFTATSFDDYRVGDLFALLRSPDNRFRPNLPSADLMKLIQAGKSLVYDAIAAADAQDNVEFFEAAFGFYGPLIDAALEEMSLPQRCTLSGATMPHTEAAMAEHRATYGHHGELDQQGRRIPNHRSEDCTHDEQRDDR
jgi:hypothetical protein